MFGTVGKIFRDGNVSWTLKLPMWSVPPMEDGQVLSLLTHLDLKEPPEPQNYAILGDPETSICTKQTLSGDSWVSVDVYTVGSDAAAVIEQHRAVLLALTAICELRDGEIVEVGAEETPPTIPFSRRFAEWTREKLQPFLVKALPVVARALHGERLLVKLVDKWLDIVPESDTPTMWTYLRSSLTVDLQGWIANHTGRKLCPSCLCTIMPGRRHEDCEERLHREASAA